MDAKPKETAPVCLDALNDQQNMALTQLSYYSDLFTKDDEGFTLETICGYLKESGKNPQKYEELSALIEENNLGGLVIKGVADDQSVTGFGAVAFTDSNGETGISYRGTDGLKLESLNDWFDNLIAAVTGTSVQCAQAETFFDRCGDPNGQNYLYGHSKGGQLSESVYSNNYHDIKKVHLLNPQPLNPYSLTADQYRAMQSDKLDIVIVELDYVWFLGALPSYGNIRIADMKHGENPHLYSSLVFQNGKIVEGQLPLIEYMGYWGLSKALSSCQATFGMIGMVYGLTVRVVDMVREDVIPAVEAFIAEVGQWLENQYAEFREAVNRIVEFLGNVKDKAVHWFNETFSRSYQYLQENDQIRVDTVSLRDYSSRLSAVNKRLKALDGQMDALYTKVGLLDMADLVTADVLTGQSWRISRCISYLNDTASDFDSAERAVAFSC